tara:strand:+ start:150 stop:353 length:204 start_codon:yes stop_codon:yes gene_type:complete
MKWALVFLYFVAGPEGGWFESERKFFSTEKDCKEHMEFFNNMPKPGTMTSRCINSNDEGWWNKKDTI